MLLKQNTLDAIAAKRVTLAFRRWRKPSVKAGGMLKTHVGVLAIEAVDKIAPNAIAEKDARSAGYPSRAALLKDLATHGEGDLYRIALRLKGADPRVALRKDAKLTKADMKSVIAALKRLDEASRNGVWTTAILRLIDKYPARRAPDLAAGIGRDPLIFKRDVRKLKELGLIESLEVGYRLSPRGRAVFAEIVEREGVVVNTARPLSFIR